MSSALTGFVATGPGGALHGVDSGGGSDALPVVLVHGINMSSETWADLIPLLASQRRVVAVDLRGHGQSHRNGPFSADDYAEDVLAVMDHLSIDRAHVVGTSFGGAVACLLGVQSPARVASVTAIGSALVFGGIDVDAAITQIRAMGLQDFFSAFMPVASFAPGVSQALIDRAVAVATRGRDMDTVIAVSTAAFASDLRDSASGITVPALVISGELDATCPLAASTAMAEVLRARHEILSGVGHVPSMEAPVKTAELISRHIDGVDQIGA